MKHGVSAQPSTTPSSVCVYHTGKPECEHMCFNFHKPFSQSQMIKTVMVFMILFPIDQAENPSQTEGRVAKSPLP